MSSAGSGRKIRLYGKPATEFEVSQEVSSLLLGDQDRKLKPLSVAKIAETLEFTRQTVYNYIEKAKKFNLLQENQDGTLLVPKQDETEAWKRFDELHAITSDPLIADWLQDLKTRKQGGKVETWQIRLRSVEIVCNTLKIPPRALIKSQKQTETYMKNFIDMYRDGTVDQIVTKSTHGRLLKKISKICEQTGISKTIIDSISRKIEDTSEKRREDKIRGKAYTTAQGVRDFCGFYGLTWKRGTGGIMSQKIVGHGKYADTKLTRDQLETASKYIVEKWGVDSDIYRWFWIGVESCARFNALFSMSLDFDKHIAKNGIKTTYILKAFESKTRQIKGGMWTKYITRPQTQQSIDALKARHGIKIYDVNADKKFKKSIFKDKINSQMIEIFLYLGLTNLYFYEHTNHVLRHIGAHYWLALLDYDYGRVAMIGGWNTIDELRKSYGEMPADKLLEGIDRSSD